MSRTNFHSSIFNLSLLFLFTLIFFTGCGVDENSKIKVNNAYNLGNSSQNALGFTKIGTEEIKGSDDRHKELVIQRDENLNINLSDMFVLESENTIVTNISFLDSKNNERKQYGDLKEIEPLEFQYEFFENSNSDQLIVFSVKKLLSESTTEYKVNIILKDKTEREDYDEGQRMLVEVIVSPSSTEILSIVEREKDSLDIKCKEELEVALKGDKGEVTIGDLIISNQISSQPLILEKKDINLKVVFTESVDILEPKLVCDKNEVLTYYFPINYILNKENGSISDVFLSENREEIIHGKCKDAVEELN